MSCLKLALSSTFYLVDRCGPNLESESTVVTTRVESNIHSLTMLNSQCVHHPYEVVDIPVTYCVFARLNDDCIGLLVYNHFPSK